MKTGRLEAFSDGVLAIVITIMVLEFKVPDGDRFEDLIPLIPKLLSYVLSFLYIGIYWNNHHHLFQIIEKVDGSVLLANLFLLFSLSLTPFTTAWMGENHFGRNPSILYGLNLLLNAIAYLLLEKASVQHEGPHSKLREAMKKGTKEYLSVFLYLFGIFLAWFYHPIAGIVCYFLVAMIWLVPDKRIEKHMS